MKKALLGLIAGVAASASFGATVNVASTGNYTSITNYTLCTTAPAQCANFLPAHNVSGTFTTTGPLPANAVNLEIGASVTSYSFSSGLDVIASSNPAARLNTLRISTDPSGNLTSLDLVQTVLWSTGTAPHTLSDRFSAIVVAGTIGTSTRNSGCQTLGTGSSGVADTCLFATVADTSRSTANAAPVSVSVAAAPVAATPIPTLSQWAMLLMASLMGLYAVGRLRRGL